MFITLLTSSGFTLCPSNSFSRYKMPLVDHLVTTGRVAQRLNALGADYLIRVREADAAYDQETSHSLTQGASFP